MKGSELREFSAAELETKISEVKKNLFNLKFQKASGQLDNPMKIKNLKKDIARIETVAREKEIGIKTTAEKEKRETGKGKKFGKLKDIKKAKETKDKEEIKNKEIKTKETAKKAVKKEKK